MPVLPLHSPGVDGRCSCRAGARCSSPGKHPRLRKGLHGASRHPEVVRRWWSLWPYANIGLATGTVLDVCDIDTNDGLHQILDLLKVIRLSGPLIRTGRGWHLWYASAGLPSRIAILPGVDWRGRGGFVVAPPSLHVSGIRYRFRQPWDTAHLPACPPALSLLVAPQPPAVPEAAPIADVSRYGQAALTGEVERVLRAPRPVILDGRRISGGGRNATLNRAAFRLGQLAERTGMTEATARRALTQAALRAGLGRAEVHRTFASGWHAGLRSPRRQGTPGP
ncbi:bifunctional DNA primase/polymerase [Actinoplanes sp. LDG1-06]|uniref:Bifunctional DNA primase/polymerase n=2 Tax=Paractinoplanes ovalisporus TaxID=2810368 RepID=A0ABS2AUA2_9ACTN|nr:bifunctional DNA primase/polymerase [Actinoplanes ovalisporus]